MRVEWHGQSAFTLTSDEATVFIDPFGDMGPLAERGMKFDYPPIADGASRDAGLRHCRAALGPRPDRRGPRRALVHINNLNQTAPRRYGPPAGPGPRATNSERGRI